MKLSPNTKWGNGTILSYRLVIGSERAKACGLVDDDGNGRTIIPVQTLNGMLLIPVDKPSETLEYKGLTTVVYEKNGIFCGEVTCGRRTSSWFVKDRSRIEQSFHSVADKLLQNAE